MAVAMTLTAWTVNDLMIMPIHKAPATKRGIHAMALSCCLSVRLCVA